MRQKSLLPLYVLCTLASATLLAQASHPSPTVANSAGANIATPAATTPITITVDATDAPRKMLHARLTIPVQPGDVTLLYPKWIPGEHEPSGPIDNLAGIVIEANGQRLPWVRDSLNMFALRVHVPAGVTTLNVQDDFLATAAATGFSAGASTSENLAMISWNEVLLYPQGKIAAEIPVTASLTLPDGWQYGTALTTTGHDGATTHFATVSLEQLIDSPVLSGRYFKEIPLAPDVTPKHFLDVAADGPEDLDLRPETFAAFNNLVREAGALYASRHYTSYHFLVTLSDQVAHFGLEHHQSSDDRVREKTFLQPDLLLLEGDLLPHEFTHSWNGKYRRPAGLLSPDYQTPMRGNLLWVYEGLTEYLGGVLATRSGIWTQQQYHDELADVAAQMDQRPGRTWRDLQDTATAAQTLYDSSGQWDNWRRGVDFYPEGQLLWLDVDTTIRQMSHGKKSIDDFCARFHGLGGNTAPKVIPYTFDDVVKNLNAVQPNDWAQFLRERLTSTAPHAPLGGVEHGGYQLVYASAPNSMMQASEGLNGVNAWYSLGLLATHSGAVRDVRIDSPAYKAGLGPGMQLVAINGRAFTDAILHAAIHDTTSAATPMQLIVENTGYFRVVNIDYHGGERYPALERNSNMPDLLDAILAPRTQPPAAK